MWNIGLHWWTDHPSHRTTEGVEGGGMVWKIHKPEDSPTWSKNLLVLNKRRVESVSQQGQVSIAQARMSGDQLERGREGRDTEVHAGVRERWTGWHSAGGARGPRPLLSPHSAQAWLSCCGDKGTAWLSITATSLSEGVLASCVSTEHAHLHRSSDFTPRRVAEHTLVQESQDLLSLHHKLNHEGGETACCLTTRNSGN